MREDRPLTAEEERLKEKFIAARGYWRPWTDFLLRNHPDFLDVYARYAGHAAASGPLSPKAVELVYVALDGSATHLFRSGLVLHMRLALAAGATAREILDTLRLATAQGLHGTLAGIEILIDELGANTAKQGSPPSHAHAALKASFLERHGEWPIWGDYLLAEDPEFLALVQELLRDDQSGGGLDPDMALYVEIALAACFTGFNAQALRLAIRRALRAGIGADAILQVLQMTAHLGVHSCSIGVPALQEVLDSTAE